MRRDNSQATLAAQAQRAQAVAQAALLAQLPGALRAQQLAQEGGERTSTPVIALRRQHPSMERQVVKWARRTG